MQTTTAYQSDYHFTSGGNLVEKNGLHMDYTGDQVCKGTRDGSIVFNASYNQGLMQELIIEGNSRRLLWDGVRRPVCIGEEEFVYLDGEAPLFQCHQDGSKTIWITPDCCVHVGSQGDESFSQSINGNGVVVFSSVNSLEAGEHIHYYHNDRQSSTHCISDPSGEKFIPVRFDRYGQWQTTKPNLKRCPGIRFSAMCFDSYSELWRSRSRLFCSLLGRYIQSDSQPGGRVGMADIFNGYAYTLNNPANFIDPGGHRVNDDMFKSQFGITIALGLLALGGWGLLWKAGGRSTYGLQFTTGFASAFVNSLFIYVANRHISPDNNPKMTQYVIGVSTSFLAGWTGANNFLTTGVNVTGRGFLTRAVLDNKYPILLSMFMPVLAMSTAIDARTKHDLFPDEPSEQNDNATSPTSQQQVIQTSSVGVYVGIYTVNQGGGDKSNSLGSMNSNGLTNLMQHEELNRELII